MRRTFWNIVAAAGGLGLSALATAQTATPVEVAPDQPVEWAEPPVPLDVAPQPVAPAEQPGQPGEVITVAPTPAPMDGQVEAGQWNEVAPQPPQANGLPYVRQLLPPQPNGQPYVTEGLPRMPTPDYQAVQPGVPAPRSLNGAPGYRVITRSGMRLGVSVSPASPAMAHQLRLRPGTGLVVDHVFPNTPAQRAGIEQYDLLVTIDDQVLTSPEQLASMVNGYKRNQEVEFTVIRQGKRMSLSLRLASPRATPYYEFQPQYPRTTPFNNFQPYQPPQYRGFPSPRQPGYQAQPFGQPRPEDPFRPQQEFDPNQMQKMPGEVLIQRGPEGQELLEVRTPDGKIISRQQLHRPKPVPPSPQPESNQTYRTIIRDENGQNAVEVRTFGGKIVSRQYLNRDEDLSPSDAQRLDSLKLRVREKADEAAPGPVEER